VVEADGVLMEKGEGEGEGVGRSGRSGRADEFGAGGIRDSPACKDAEPGSSEVTSVGIQETPHDRTS